MPLPRWLRFCKDWAEPAVVPEPPAIVYSWGRIRNHSSVPLPLSVYGKRGWVEPVQPPPAPYPVRVQQALCLTLQKRPLAAGELNGFVSQTTLQHLFAQEFLVRDGPFALIGPQTERLYGKRNYLELLSVFDTPPLFQVEFNGTEVGWIHELSLQPRRDGSDPVILLGGRSWWVRFVNWDKKTVSVEPSSDGDGRSRWLGTSAPLSFEICQSMRQVLASEFVSQNWSRRAAAELGSFRKKAIADSAGTTLHSTDRGCVWWTFGGLRANALMAGWLRSANMDSRFDNLRLVLDCPAPELSLKIGSVETQEVPMPQKFTAPKFADALPEPELLAYAQHRLYDELGARRVLVEPIVTVAALTPDQTRS